MMKPHDLQLLLTRFTPFEMHEGRAEWRKLLGRFEPTDLEQIPMPARCLLC
jgi:hypothetical protein